MPIESIIEGTWASDEAPPEWADFVLMRRMHWSWEQLQATPVYVRRYCLDILGMLGTYEEQQAAKANAKSKRARAG